MLYKVQESFSCLCITADNPEGKIRSFRKTERIMGDKKEIHADSKSCNFVADDFLAIGVPLQAISPDGRAK